MHLFDPYRDHDYYFELPREEERDALSITRCSTAHHGDVRAFPRANRTFKTARNSIPGATSSTDEPPVYGPWRPWRSSAPAASPGEILTAPFRDAAHRDLGCFHQQETQYRTPRLGDMSEPSPIATGVAETGLRMYLAEKKARKVGCRTRPDTFSSPVGRQNLRNCGNFQRFLQ